MAKKISASDKKLIERYLMWFYKKAQEDLDWIDRKFTQLSVDGHVFKQLSKRPKGITKKQARQYDALTKEFEQYMSDKQKKAIATKFSDARTHTVKAEYLFLQARVRAVESTIRSFLGAAVLRKIKALYQQEMMRRILEAREH